jgi:hypothetical protein
LRKIFLSAILLSFFGLAKADTVGNNFGSKGGGGGTTISVQQNGSSINTTVSTINFVGGATVNSVPPGKVNVNVPGIYPSTSAIITPGLYSTGNSTFTSDIANYPSGYYNKMYWQPDSSVDINHYYYPLCIENYDSGVTVSSICFSPNLQDIRFWSSNATPTSYGLTWPDFEFSNGTLFSGFNTGNESQGRKHSLDARSRTLYANDGATINIDWSAKKKVDLKDSWAATTASMTAAAFMATDYKFSDTTYLHYDGSQVCLYVLGVQQQCWPSIAPTATYALLEDNTFLLLEDGTKLILE